MRRAWERVHLTQKGWLVYCCFYELDDLNRMEDVELFGGSS